MSLILNIPGDQRYEIEHIVFDLNGTLAIGGQLSDETVALLKNLSAQASLHIITADTHGTAPLIEKRLEGAATVKVVRGSQTTEDKEAFIEALGASHTIAVGNGANDMAMFRKAALAIGIIGGEGAFAPLMTVSDIVVTNIEAALCLLLEPNRMIATLRR
ncbi:HAD family hydrolase [Tindallia californiensis]|uniref:Soluble P-type ATPase n=1 Tax=Tindallia californiensis TaxID=159292 RepID=A0A1H3P969_9FIRM|nr:HAD family hydrolase [Tindallia californiensis]SDY97385.1 Soluble P-type ATPase [Tindallia californiensis]